MSQTKHREKKIISFTHFKRISQKSEFFYKKMEQAKQRQRYCDSLVGRDPVTAGAGPKVAPEELAILLVLLIIVVVGVAAPTHQPPRAAAERCSGYTPWIFHQSLRNVCILGLTGRG